MAKKFQGEDGKIYIEKKPIYKRWWFIVVTAFVVLSVIGSLFGGQEPPTSTPAHNEPQAATTANSETAPEPKEAETIIPVSAIDLYTAYENNEVSADQQFKGKTCQIVGTVDDIGVVLGETYVTLSSGDMYSIVGVQCMFKDKAEIDKVAQLQKGANVTIIGKVDGKSINVGVRDCRFA